MCFSSFLEKEFVVRVKRRSPILMLRFWRSTYDVLIWSGSGRPRTTVRSVLSRDRRAVALLRFRRDAVVLDQDRVVDSSIKSRVYGIQVDVVSIRRELNAIRQT